MSCFILQSHMLSILGVFSSLKEAQDHSLTVPIGYSTFRTISEFEMNNPKPTNTWIRHPGTGSKNDTIGWKKD